jgi:hypothetical protein
MQTIYLLRRFDIDFVQPFEDCEECEDVAIRLNQSAMDLGLDKIFYVEECKLLKDVEPDMFLKVGVDNYVTV